MIEHRLQQKSLTIKWGGVELSGNYKLIYNEIVELFNKVIMVSCLGLCADQEHLPGYKKKTGEVYMRKYLVTMLVCLLLSGSFVGANAKIKTIRESETWKSIVGIELIYVGVEGRYDVEGYKITKWRGTDYDCKGNFGYGFSSPYSKWMDDCTEFWAHCRAGANFYWMVNLQGTIFSGLSSGTYSIDAVGTTD